MRQHCLSCESCLSYDLVNPVVEKKERNVMDELIGETQAAMIACSAKRTGGILQRYIAFFLMLCITKNHVIMFVLIFFSS